MQQREKRRKFVEIDAWTVLISIGTSRSCIICTSAKGSFRKSRTIDHLSTCKVRKGKQTMSGSAFTKGPNNTQVESMVGTKSLTLLKFDVNTILRRKS